MRLIQRLAVGLMVVCGLGLAGCGGSIHVSDNDASVKVPPGQIRKEMTPGHNK